MKNFKYIPATALLSAAFLFSTPVFAAEKAITLLSTAGNAWVVATQGGTFTVDVHVDDVSEIAGAAFTVTFDPAALTLSEVESDYFTTFTAQGITATNDTGYDSPLIFNSADSGAMLAAARIDNTSSGSQVIFTLTFTATSTVRGSYPISVTESIISNTAAGYSATGEEIPIFVGIDDTTTPTSYPTHTATVTGLTATIAAEDYDGDGIPDEWELNYIPPGFFPSDSDALTHYTATGDYDGDGYSDLQEYQNSLNEEQDPDGFDYDPAAANTAGGTGYKKKAGIIPILPLLLGD